MQQLRDPPTALKCLKVGKNGQTGEEGRESAEIEAAGPSLQLTLVPGKSRGETGAGIEGWSA